MNDIEFNLKTVAFVTGILFIGIGFGLKLGAPAFFISLGASTLIGLFIHTMASW